MLNPKPNAALLFPFLRGCLRSQGIKSLRALRLHYVEFILSLSKDSGQAPRSNLCPQRRLLRRLWLLAMTCAYLLFRQPLRQMVPTLGVEVLKGVILLYRWTISPLLGPMCRFSPSCSAYALAALQKYGILKGIRLIGLRVAKCHPWHPGGIDPLP